MATTAVRTTMSVHALLLVLVTKLLVFDVIVTSMWIGHDEILSTDPGTPTNCIVSALEESMSARCTRPPRGTTANLSCCGFHNFSFLSLLSSNITVLDLSDNFIQEIHNGTFAKFSDLETLNMSRNNLSVLQKNSFAGLSNLKILNLHGNRLTMKPSTFPSTVFMPLKSLQELWINNNMQEGNAGLEYPHVALSDLRNLISLYMDGLKDSVFGIGFSNLTKLRNLTLVGPEVGWCNLGTITNETFVHLSQITKLKMEKCNISGATLHPEAFRPLPNLTHLDVSRNTHLNLAPLSTALKPLSQLEVLNMYMIVEPWSPGQCVTAEFVQNLPESLTHLDASSNSLENFEGEVFSGNLTKLKLKQLNLNGNRFVFGDYLRYLHILENLESLKLNGATKGYRLPYAFPSGHGLTGCCNVSTSHWSQTEDPLVLTLPFNLKNVSWQFAGLSYELTEFHFNETNTLQYLNLDGNNIPELQGPITGLNQLKVLSLKRCNIQRISSEFFQTFPALEHLDLSDNRFGLNAFQKGSKPLFKKLINLISLNISFVYFTNMTENSFEGLNNVETIDMSKNFMYIFNVTISHMEKLNFINFSYLNLHELNQNTRFALSNISSVNKNLTIDLSKNPIYCSCAHRDFIAWAVNSSILTTGQEYLCSYDDKSDKRVMNYDEIHNILQRQCVSNYVIFLTVLSGTFVTAIFIFGAIVYRFRWKIRYLYYSAYLYYKQRTGNKEGGGDYKFDVFISYAHEDDEFTEHTLHPQLENRGIRVHIHGRDFRAGDLITSNIVNAVQSSRHTLVVLTKHYVRSQWGNFELQMANMESVHTGRQVLMFLLMEDLNRNELSSQLLFQIQSNTYIKYPQCEEHQRQLNMEQFWRKLATDLRS